MSVRAKMKVDKISDEDSGYFKSKIVHLSFVYSNDPNSENKKFWDATPQGKMTMEVVNQTAAEFFTPGKHVYVDFSEAPKD